MARTHHLRREQLVRQPLSEVFAFFADPENLEAITPDDLRFEIRTPRPIAMRVGATIEYRLTLLGVGFAWLTRIEAYEPERRFVDVQVKGPYRLWRHTHAFESVPEGTIVRDHVEYALPFGPLGEVAQALFVRGRLAHIFDFRQRRIAEMLERGRRTAQEGTVEPLGSPSPRGAGRGALSDRSHFRQEKIQFPRTSERRAARRLAPISLPVRCRWRR